MGRMRVGHEGVRGPAVIGLDGQDGLRIQGGVVRASIVRKGIFIFKRGGGVVTGEFI